MRRNIYRGKRADNNEWIKGYLIRGARTYIATYEAINYMVVSTNHTTSIELIEVDSQTVCQCLDRCDINGRDVFENDLVSFERFLDKHVGRVVFNPNTSGFEVWYSTVVGGFGETATHKMNFANIEKLEIVGNVFDDSSV